MDFGEQIKRVRAGKNLTQQQMADQLNVSRQAISNWENNRNLPDIEMLIGIAKDFDLTLDELILGGNNMNNMAEKLINDGSETKRVKMNLMCLKIGAAFLVVAILSFLGALLGPVVSEDFFMAISTLSFFGSVVAFLVTGAKNLISTFKKGPQKN